jgi:PAS domain S-box-containing protein
LFLLSIPGAWALHTEVPDVDSAARYARHDTPPIVTDHPLALDRPQGIWETHRNLIVGVAFVLLVQLMMIAALLINRRRRMAAERLLAESEERFRSGLEMALEDKRQYEEGLELLLKMSQQADALTKKQLYARALEVAVKATRSRVGCLRNHNPGDKTAACLLYPPGDEDSKSVAAVAGSDNVGEHRLSMPIPEGDVAGMAIEVGGKEGEYNDEDRRQLTLVANMLQKILLRRRIEAALYESEARFRFITDLSPGLIWVTDENKQCTWFNRTWLDFTGRNREQDLGTGWTDCVHADDLAGYYAVADRHFDARLPFAAEARLRRRDGAYRWMLSLGQPRFDESGSFKGYVGTCLDITERKQAEQEREQFQTFFRLSRDMMCIIGMDGRFKKVNPAFTQVLGYPEAEFLARPFTDFVLPDDRESTLEDIEEKFRGGGPLAFENRFRCKDGTVVRLSWVVSADPDDSALYATARDFTALRHAEEQLNKLWLAVEQTSQSIVITDTEARIEYVNRAFCETTGYSIEEVLGKNPRMLHSGLTEASTYAEMWATLKRGDVWLGEFSNRHKDGTIYIGSARISPVRQPDGQITHYLSILEDITERKRTTEAIRQSKVLLQNVIDATPDWIYVKDREHRFMLVNKECARAFNLFPAEMLGRCDTDFVPARLSIGKPDQGIETLHDDDDAVFDGQSIHHASEKIFFENGEIRVFDSFKIPMRDSKQQIYGALCYRRDITENFNKELEQQALETQLRQAQKMELIGHLTGGIAHDFNNILAAVFGYAELMQMSPVIKSNAQLELYLQEILQAGIRAKELVSQLLTFSHRREAASEAINVAPIVKEVAKLLRSTMPTSISIDCTLADNLPEVLISPVQLHQVMMNLGVNARDAMARTGLVEIRADRTFVDQSTACASCHQNFSGSYLLISVRDSGSGITPENMMRIFDPFFTTKDVGRGSGLGLSVLHGIVHSANGHIKVLSAPGEGTEFRIYLPPHSKGSERLAGDSKPDEEKSPVRGHIMVVDDEASIVRFMTVLLEQLGCRVTGLTSASEALATFRADPYAVDLVLTDQTMPELSGVELARAMLACRADIPIMLSTGYSNAIDDDTARQIGIRRFLMKPVPAKVLADIVAEYLSVPTPGGPSELAAR